MTSRQYWEMDERRMLRLYPSADGCMKVERMPRPSQRMPGIIYVRPANSGRWGKSRMVRYTPYPEA